MMVIGATPLTRELYGKSIIAEYNKNYAVNIRNRFQAEAVHMIITNYN
jgi:DNA adenine methylase